MHSGTRWNPFAMDWENVFFITWVRYIGVLFHTFYYYWAKKYRSLNWGSNVTCRLCISARQAEYWANIRNC